MFVLGGEDKGVYLCKNFEYDYVSLTFEERTAMITEKVEFGCIYFGGNHSKT